MSSIGLRSPLIIKLQSTLPIIKSGLRTLTSVARHVRNLAPNSVIGNELNIGGKNNGGLQPKGNRFWRYALLFGTAATAAAALSACFFDTSGITPPDSEPDASRDSGFDGEVDATHDAGLDGGLDADAQQPVDDRPSIIPPQKLDLHNDGVLIKWDPPQELPVGKTLIGYEISVNNGAWNYTSHRFYPIDIAQPNMTYNIRVRSVYSGHEPSDLFDVLQISSKNTLVARYEMLENNGGTFIGDSSGHGYNATLTCDPLTAWNQSGVIFDGSCYIDTGDRFGFESTNKFTIVARRIIRSAVSACATIFSKSDRTDTSLYRGYWLGFTSSDNLQGELISDWSSGNRLIIKTINTFSSLNTMESVAMTHDASEPVMESRIKFYSDGAQQNTEAVYSSLSGSIVNTVPSRIAAAIATGGPVEDSSCGIQGIMGGIVIFSDTLDTIDIHESYCYGKGLEVYPPIQTATDVPQDCKN